MAVLGGGTVSYERGTPVGLALPQGPRVVYVLLSEEAVY